MKEILKGSAVLLFFKIIGAISLFLTHILISRYYGVEMLGVFNLIIGLMIMGTIISKNGLDMYIVRVVPSLDGNYSEISSFLKLIFKIILLASISVSVVFLFSLELVNRYLFKSFDASNYLFGLLFVMIPFTFFSVIPEIFRAFHEIKIYSFFKNFAQHFMVLTLLCIVIYFNLNISPVYILFISIVIITSFLIIVLLKFLKKNNIDIFISVKYNKQILLYSYPMFLTSAMTFLMGYVDTFMIGYYLDEYQVGIYSACIKLSFFITFVLASVNGFIAPKLSHAYTRNDYVELKQIYKSSVKYIVLSTSPIFLVLFIFPDFFLGVFGEEFKVATSTLMVVTVAYLINAIIGPVGYVLNMTDNQNVFMKILLVGLAVNILFNIVLIPIYQINGAAVATLLSMALWNIISFYILKRKKII